MNLQMFSHYSKLHKFRYMISYRLELLAKQTPIFIVLWNLKFQNCYNKTSYLNYNPAWEKSVIFMS